MKYIKYASTSEKVSIGLEMTAITLYLISTVLAFILQTNMNTAFHNIFMIVMLTAILTLNLKSIKKRVTQLEIVSSKEE